MPIKAAVIIPAAGSGSRMGFSTPKQFHELAGLPILVRTVRAFHPVAEIDTIVLPVPAAMQSLVQDMVARFKLAPKSGNLIIVIGGRTRQDSVRAGLDALPPDTEVVLVHDGARPLISTDIIETCLQEAARSGAAMAAIPVIDTLKAVTVDRKITWTVDRQGLWQAQTPQAARMTLLQEAYAAAEKTEFIGTDEAALLERIGCPVTVVDGSKRNLKITHPDDLLIAEAILMQSENRNASPAITMSLKIGHGYDAHRFVTGRPLVLGGVTVPHSAGLSGHSDADVLTHAFCDAILGALGSGDIGVHFPDSDQQYKNVRSIKLLEHVVALAAEQNYALVNGDITVVAQEPKLSPHLLAMKENMARACGVAPEVINIKATTTEKMGFVGRSEGIAAHAVVLLAKNNPTGRNQVSG